MTNANHPATDSPQGSANDPRRIVSERTPKGSFLNRVEQKRYEFIALKLEGYGADPAIVGLCKRWAEEHRVTAEIIARLEREDLA